MHVYKLLRAQQSSIKSSTLKGEDVKMHCITQDDCQDTCMVSIQCSFWCNVVMFFNVFSQHTEYSVLIATLVVYQLLRRRCSNQNLILKQEHGFQTWFLLTKQVHLYVLLVMCKLAVVNCAQNLCHYAGIIYCICWYFFILYYAYNTVHQKTVNLWVNFVIFVLLQTPPLSLSAYISLYCVSQTLPVMLLSRLV